MLVAGGIDVGTERPLAAAALASSDPGPNTRPHPLPVSWIRNCTDGTSNSAKIVLGGFGINAELKLEGSVLVFDTFGLFSLLAAEPDQIGYVGPCADAEVFYDPFQ